MSVVSTAGYLARRAAQKERVRILYRRALKNTLNWAVHRHLFYHDASDLRERFEANKHVGKFPDKALLIKRSLLIGFSVLAFSGNLQSLKEDLDTIDRLIADAEESYNMWRHPDPYIVPWAPGGSKFHRNPTPPSGIEIVYDYGKEDND